MSSILIIGGNGFIGSHVVDVLLENNHSVSVLDVSTDKFRDQLANVKYYYGRLEDSAVIEKALIDIDVVVHLVSTTYPSNSNKNITYDIESNLIATITLLDNMLKSNVRRIVYLSSGGTVYGPTNIIPTPENHPMNPISSYGIVKLAIEKYLQLYNSLHGISHLVFRPSNVYGPRQRYAKLQGVTANFLFKYLSNESISIWGDGKSSKDYIYVKDVANAIRVGIESDLNGIYNLGSGESISVNEVVDLLRGIVTNDLKVSYELAKGFDVQNMCLDISKITTESNWQPAVSFSNGLLFQYNWMKDILNSTEG